MRTGIEAPVAIEGDRVVPVVRRSRQGGWLVFVFNLERATAQRAAAPALADRPRRATFWPRPILRVEDNAFSLSDRSVGGRVVHCTEV